MTTHTLRNASLKALAGFCLLLAGCSSGPKIVPVSGQVLIDGKPLEHGVVQVAPAGFRPAVGTIGPGGRFTLETLEPGDGCVVGTHPAAVIANESTSPSSQRWHAPKKYADASTSGLQVTIDGPTDSLKIELSWDGGKPFVEHYNKE